MAVDLEKIVKIVFAGDDTGLGKTITSVGGGLDALSAKVGKATQPFADLTDTIIKIDAVLAGLAVGAFVVATRAAGEFGDSFNEILTLIDGTDEEVNIFREGLIEYARDSGKSFEDITKSLYNVISAGEDYTTSLDFLEAAEQLAISTKSELNTAIEILRPTLTAFGKGTEDAAGFANTLFLAVKNGKLTLTELESVLASVTPIASASGVSFAEIAAAMAALTAAGYKVPEAATALKGALTGLFAPSTAAKKAFEDLEKELGKNWIAGKDLNEIFAIMVERTGGTLEGMKALIPRVEGASAALVLGGKASKIFSDALDQMRNNTEAASEAHKKMAENFALSNQNIINNIKATLIEIGLPLLDEWGKLAEQIAIIFGKAAEGGSQVDWSKFFDPLIKQTEGLLDELTAYFAGIGAALPKALEGIDWSGFTKAIEDLVETGKDLFGQLLGGLDLTKAEDLEIAIQKVVDTFKNWIKLTEGLIEGLTPFLVKLAELASKFGELEEDGVKFFGELTGWGKAINSIAGIIPNLTGALNILSGSIGLLSITRIPAMIAALGGGAAGLGGALLGLIGSGGALTLFAAAIALIPGTKLNTWLKDNSDAFNSLAGGIENAWLKMRDIDTAQIANLKTSGEQKQLLGELAVTVNNWAKSLDDLPDEVAPQIGWTDLDEWVLDLKQVQFNLENLDGYVATTQVDLLLDEFFADIDKVEQALVLDAALKKEIDLELDKFFGDIDAAEKKLKEVPDTTLVEIKLQGEIDIELAKIKAQAETLQGLFEWTAKVEIAEIEAQAKEIEAIAGTIEAAWQSTGDVISAALGVLDANLSAGRWLDVIKIVRREQDLQEDIWETQKELVEAQTALIIARAAAIKEGKGLIQITTDGLEPELEQVLYKIVQKAQVKANEEGFNALLGI